jgi:biotin carboxyl carrier protein
MQYEVEIESRVRKVSVTPAGDGFAVEVDGRTWHVDAARLDRDRMSLLIGVVSQKRDTARSAAPHASPVSGQGRIGPGVSSVSCEVAISSGPAAAQLIVHVGTTQFAATLNGRRRRQDVDASGGARSGAHPDAPRALGPERMLAPMPGKVVRILVHKGDAVRARQPLVVVEAMKMENELRAGRDGHVTAIHVQEGASVEAGALVVVIE